MTIRRTVLKTPNTFYRLCSICMINLNRKEFKMTLQDDITRINNQTKQIQKENEDIKKIMSNFGKEVDDFLKD